MEKNTNFIYKNLSPFKWFVLENFPFIEADFDALTEWQLYCKIGKEINKIIDSQNIVGEQAETLTNAFNNLKNYVNNYFKNLDVQDEINNKLNEMAESGKLTDIIAQYLSLAGVLAFNNVNDMKNAQNLTNGSICKTLGFYNLNDNGGAFYKIRNITNNDIVDEITIISLYDNLLIAELITQNTMNIKQFGAIEDGITNDLNSFNKALLKCEKIILNNKSYKINDSINILSNKKLIGNNSTIICENNENTIIGDNITNIEIKGINFENCYHAIYITNSSHLKFENLTISSKNWGLTLQLCDYFTFNNITFNQERTDTWSNTDGIHINGGKYGIITNIYGTTDDDLIALNADENNQNYGDITNIIIDNINTINNQIHGANNSTYCGIKLLSRGSLIDNITIKNSIIGIDHENGIVLTGFNNANIKNIYVNNCKFILNANHTKKIILIETSFDNIKFNNCDFIVNLGAYDSTFIGCEQLFNYGNLLFENCNFIDNYNFQKNYFKLKGNYKNITLNNIKIINNTNILNNRLITFEDGTISDLTINNVYIEKMDRLLNLWASGIINNLNCNNIKTDTNILNFINASGKLYNGSLTNILLKGNSPAITIGIKQDDDIKCVLYADNITTPQNDNIHINDDGWKYNVRIIKGISNFEPQVRKMGDMYYNINTNKLNLCTNTNWVELN